MNYVSFEPIGNYGNIFFQYALMRLFADRCNMIPRLPIFEQRHAEFLNDMLSLENEGLYGGVNRMPLYGEICRHGLDPKDERNYLHYWKGQKISRDAQLSGYFQDSALYEDTELVKSYFNIPEVDPIDGVCVSLRLGSDFKSLGLVQEPNSVLDILLGKLDSLQFNNLTIVTDTYDIGYLNHFAHFSPKVVCRESCEPDKDFADIMSYKKLIITNSTFSWWAAYLGHAEEVYMPSDYGTGYEYVKLNDIPGKKVNHYNVSYKSSRMNLFK